MAKSKRTDEERPHFKKGDKVTDGRGNVGIVEEVQRDGNLYIQWVSYSGEPTRDLTADNNPDDFEKLEYAEGGAVDDFFDEKVEAYLRENYPRYTDELLIEDNDGKELSDEEYNNAFFKMVDDLRANFDEFNPKKGGDRDLANSYVEDYMSNPQNNVYYENGKLKKKYNRGGGIKQYSNKDFQTSVDKLKEYIKKYPYIWTKNGKEYIPIEGWQFAGLIMGYSSRVTEVNPTANGYMAKAEVIDSDGKVVCSGFGLVDKSETKWKDKPDYQLVGFAQTRAVSRALRNCLSWMVKAAGFSTTPAEEMYGIKPEKRTGKSKSTAHSTPAVPPVPPANDDYDFPFDNPEFDNPVPPAPPAPPMPQAPPMPPAPPAPSGGLNAEEIEDTLRAMAAKARANRIVIKSEDFMAEIDNVLLGNNVDLQLSMLKNAVSYMDENNIILQSPRYMSKLRKVANQEPF